MEELKGYSDLIDTKAIWTEKNDWRDNEFLRQTKKDLAWLREECQDCKKDFDYNNAMKLEFWNKQYEELFKKWDLAIKEIFKKLIEIIEVNHSITLMISKRLWDILKNKFWLNIISINKETVMVQLNKRDLDKLKKAGIRNFIDSQSENLQNWSQNLEQMQKMNWIIRDFIFAEIVTNKNNNLGILAASLITNQACNQYFEHYRYFQWNSRIEARKRFESEIDKLIHEITYSMIAKEAIPGRWHVNKISIAKYNKRDWQTELPNWSTEIITSSADTIVWDVQYNKDWTYWYTNSKWEKVIGIGNGPEK